MWFPQAKNFFYVESTHCARGAHAATAHGEHPLSQVTVAWPEERYSQH
jgi:hypothetical protein